MKRVLFETDFLASQPVFYNEKTGKASHNINDVIDYANLELHPEGVNNYLDFGYSVLEQTPVKHVKFLRHSSRMWVDEQGKLSVEYLDDPVARWLDYRLSESDVVELIRERVRAWERTVEGEIVIPTSGGYDSRLLNWCIKEKSRIRSFTYGISENQAESYEVVYAKRLSEILGTRWEQIQLGDFHRYLDEWDCLFGVSTHAHGMYHIEFYDKILPKVHGGNPLLSGIIGDAWAGSVNIPELASCVDVSRLGYTHGLQADSAQSAFCAQQSLLSAYYDTHKDRLADSRFRVVEAMRFKMVLLSYLFRVPMTMGFKPWSPFLDVDVCTAMLNVPTERRRDRIWQKELFRKVGLECESMALQATRQSTLDMQALRRIPARALDVKLLREVVKPEYLRWIDRELSIGSLPDRWQRRIARWLAMRRGGWRVSQVLDRLCDAQDSRCITAYFAYVTLRPIENLLRRRSKE